MSKVRQFKSSKKPSQRQEGVIIDRSSLKETLLQTPVITPDSREYLDLLRRTFGDTRTDRPLPGYTLAV